MANNLLRIVIAGLAGDSGKTIVSLSLANALVRRGLAISAFKKGPDYIDAAWLGYITKTSCRNLDTFLVPENDVYNSFCLNAAKSDISIIEGNRGIYDGMDVSGTHSTAGLAKLLQAPVVLVVDSTKTTRTIAALVKGIIEFDNGLNIAGIILNRIGGKRHKEVVTKSIEKYCSVPVLGAIPKLGDDSEIIPGRHLGLVTPAEYDKNTAFEEKLNEIAENYIDIDKIIELANNAEKLEYNSEYVESQNNEKKVKIGYFKDSVFTFYYPENLELLEQEGAELIGISSVDDKQLPDIDALYIGGGFPETQAEMLVQNQSMMNAVRKASVAGMPIYAECGGLIYLSRSLKWDGKFFPMAGIFPVDLKMSVKPVGHGYSRLTVNRSNPYFNTGDQIKGHEFHYSGVSDVQNEEGLGLLQSCMTVDKGTGIGNQRDGLLFNNTMACYTHIHALGNRNWAMNMVRAATRYNSNSKQTSSNRNFISLIADEYRASDDLLMAAGSVC